MPSPAIGVPDGLPTVTIRARIWAPSPMVDEHHNLDHNSDLDTSIQVYPETHGVAGHLMGSIGWLKDTDTLTSVACICSLNPMVDHYPYSLLGSLVARLAETSPMYTTWTVPHLPYSYGLPLLAKHWAGEKPLDPETIEQALLMVGLGTLEEGLKVVLEALRRRAA